MLNVTHVHGKAIFCCFREALNTSKEWSVKSSPTAEEATEDQAWESLDRIEFDLWSWVKGALASPALSMQI